MALIVPEGFRPWVLVGFKIGFLGREAAQTRG